jgi:hypothetical protein
MTPYEAVFGKKPNLGGLQEWGEKAYVRIEGGSKLGGRVREGRWLGVDEESKGVRIYWPDTKSVNVERNVYYNESSASHFEGEQDNIVVTKTDSPAPINPVPVKPPSTTVENNDSEAENSTSHVQKPSQRVQDLLEGKGSWSKLSTSSLEFSYLPLMKRTWWIGLRTPLMSTLWLSRRISLSPFPTLRHHSGTIPGPSTMFQAFPSRHITLLPFQSIPSLTPSTPSTSRPSFTVSGIPASHPDSPFLSTPRFYPLLSISIRTPFLPIILRSPRSPFLSGSSPFLTVQSAEHLLSCNYHFKTVYS